MRQRTLQSYLVGNREGWEMMDVTLEMNCSPQIAYIKGGEACNAKA